MNLFKLNKESVCVYSLNSFGKLLLRVKCFIFISLNVLASVLLG